MCIWLTEHSTLSADGDPGGLTNVGTRYKEGGDMMVSLLIQFYNMLLSNGELPKEWKVAHIIPIHKGGSKSRCENYRPISLTCAMCKILEAVIKKDILVFLSSNNMIFSSQHGFLPRRSTATALLSFLEEVSLSIDDNQLVDAIYLDFRKAFDSVPHKRLVEKLKSYGIQSPLICWISSFLSDRYQLVKIGNSFSRHLKVVSGVPQGSILGPLLFLIFINDIDEVIKNASIIKYADDIRLFLKFSRNTNSNCGPELLQADLHGIEMWCKTWLLKLNTSKCNCIYFGLKNSSHTYLLNNIPLPSVSSERDLGVLLTADLKPSLQCLQVANRANKILGCIRLSFKYLDASTLIVLYKALVLPVLEYCTVAWCPFFVKDIETLEKVQRRMTRMLPGLRHLPYEVRLKALGLMTLHTRRIKHDLIFVFKLLHGMIDLDPLKFFSPCSDSRTRGHDFKLCFNFSRLTFRNKFFSQRVVHYWNSLPNDCVNASSLPSFKQALSQHFDRNGFH